MKNNEDEFIKFDENRYKNYSKGEPIQKQPRFGLYQGLDVVKDQLSSILEKLQKDNLTENDLIEFKITMKNIEKKIKEQNKPKTVTISGRDHAIIKKHCTNLNLNIGEWVTKVLLKEIYENNCIINDDISHDDFIKSESKRILKDFVNISDKYIFIKSNTILNGIDFIPNGNSYIDGSFIYRIKRDSYDCIINELKSRNIKIELITISEISLSLITDTDSEINIEYFSKLK